ncbi:MAG: chemotaxis protein CheD [Elusimicrobiota bacterium]
MSEIYRVGIGDLGIAENNSVITTSSLGSCIAVIIYDPVKKLGGLAHIMHADSSMVHSVSNPAKCADTGIRELLNRMKEKGGIKSRYRSYIIGGASMFTSLDSKLISNIGLRNVDAAKMILEGENITIAGESTGGTHGRTVEFNTSTGELIIRSKRFGMEKL